MGFKVKVTPRQVDPAGDDPVDVATPLQCLDVPAANPEAAAERSVPLQSIFLGASSNSAVDAESPTSLSPLADG